MEAIRCEKSLNIPNLLTLLRIALLPVIVWRFQRGDMSGALTVYLLAMLTDAADGVIARRFAQITTLGKLLDPMADKLCLLTLIGLFAADGQIPLWMVCFLLIKELILAVGSVAALHRGHVVYALPIGKVTTGVFVLSMIARFLLLRTAADILLWISVMLSLVSLIWYSMVLFQSVNMQNERE